MAEASKRRDRRCILPLMSCRVCRYCFLRAKLPVCQCIGVGMVRHGGVCTHIWTRSMPQIQRSGWPGVVKIAAPTNQEKAWFLLSSSFAAACPVLCSKNCVWQAAAAGFQEQPHKYPVDREPHDGPPSFGLGHPLHPHHASASASFSFPRPTTLSRRCCLALGGG